MAVPTQDLEYHYTPSRWSHRMSPDEVLESHIDTIKQASKISSWCLDAETDISYGSGEKQKLDVFTAKNANCKGAPIFVFIHGGYWQALGREVSSFMAPPITKAGAAVMVIGYDYCPEVSMDKIMSEIKEAIRFILKLAKERQSSGVYLCGHSAGAHLASMMLASEFCEDDAFDSEMIKGAVLVSGVYDIRPIVKTSINEPLKLTEDDAWRFSPVSFINEISAQSKKRDVLIAVGEFDPAEFRRQSSEMERDLRKRGVKTRYVDVPDTDHFSVIEKLQNENYTLTKEIIRLMGLNK